MRMTDKELKKLALYIADELTKPSEDMIDKLGHYIMFFDQGQLDEYEQLNLKHEIEQLKKLLKINLEQENYEAASMIHAKIKKLEDDMKQG
jgi:protein-arginine kinase activator protein McsA|tara:strand:- start:99 stop:371 length:273 start_codon:yes stop_codon:yes gene_type:complete